MADALEASRHLDTREVMMGLERHVAMKESRTVAHAALDRCVSGDALPIVIGHAARALGALSDFTSARRLIDDATARAGSDEMALRRVRYASAKLAYAAGDWGTAVLLLSGTLLPDDRRERVEVLLILAMCVVAVGGTSALAHGLDFASRAEALIDEDDPVAQVQLARARLLCHYFAADYARAAEIAEEALALARRAGLRFEECAHLHNAGEQYLRLGDRERARQALTESLEIARDIGAEPVQRHNEVLLAFLDGNAPRLVHLADSFQEAKNPWHEVFARYWLGRLLAKTDETASRRHMARALFLARNLKVKCLQEEIAALHVEA
jgi:tetratricopeptide (TPR) repeat protein